MQKQLPTQWEGKIVDDVYPLLEHLGGNDTGGVFRTEHEGQPAAIRVVTAVGPSAEQRVWHWRLAAKAKHPNLVEIYKAGRAQLDGIFIAYVVMEFAEENLGQVLPERPLTTEEARAMLGPAVDALAFLHGDGFVHGALKPGNIMAVQDCLKLSSDSLRRIEDSNDLPLPQGSYRAPELAPGEKLSQAADIWALGVTLVESLTQQPPVLSESEPLLPDGIEQPFLDVVRHCLRLFPKSDGPQIKSSRA